MELLCPAKKHGILVRPGVLEIKCSSRFCGAGQGTVVLHRFDVMSGELLETVQFKDPATRKEGSHGSPHRSAVRSA